MKEWSARGDCALPLRKTKDVLCFKYITWWQHMKKTVSDYRCTLGSGDEAK